MYAQKLKLDKRKIPTSRGKFINSFEDNRPRKVIQRVVAAGFVPSIPDAFRKFTQIYGDKSHIYRGGERFYHVDKVINQNRVPGNITFTSASGSHNISDGSGNDLFYPTDARVFTPEVDHIVPQSEGGANDLSNARVLSKDENTSAWVTRPANNQREIRVYSKLNVNTASDGKYGGLGFSKNCHDGLNVAELNALLDFQGQACTHADYSSIGKTHLNAITAIPNGKNTKNGIEVNNP